MTKLPRSQASRQRVLPEILAEPSTRVLHARDQTLRRKIAGGMLFCWHPATACAEWRFFDLGGICPVRIAMIGGGYVGLVSAACFAEFGIEVTVVEADPRKLASL